MPLRLQLPEAPVAERLQRQDGFAAIKNFTRDIAEYRHPIVRLCGFYVPLEPATLAHGALNALFFYFCWWNEPLDALFLIHV